MAIITKNTKLKNEFYFWNSIYNYKVSYQLFANEANGGDRDYT